jgi:Fe-Mn family superoxide dismutase
MANKTNRRTFIAKTVKSSLAIGVGFSAAAPLLQSFSTSEKMRPLHFNTGFDQQPLPYKYDALEDVIDAMTMELHYSKHAAAYCKNVKDAAAAEKVDVTKPLEAVLTNISKYSAKMRNNGGGHYNHEMFWQCMRPKRENNTPSGKLLETIEKQFFSFDNFKKQFSEFGKNRFGSGWAWLYINKENVLTIGSTINQDNPLMDVCEIKGYPLLGLDVWEHAYYLKYQNRRAEYIENWWKVVNWDYVADRLHSYHM